MASGELINPLPTSRRWWLPRGPVIQQFFFGGWTVGVFLFLYLPIVLLVVYSFNDSRLGVSWTGFTTRWYGQLFGNTVLWHAAKNSLIVGLSATFLALLIGTSAAWLLHRYRFPARRFIGLLILIPMIIPEVLMGTSLLVLFVNAGWPLGYTTLIIAHTTFCFPFVQVAVQARLSGLDPALEEAALDLGATPWQAFRLVIVPYLMPAIIAGALMAFTLSFDEYIVTLFTTGAESQTLPLKVYGMVKRGGSPELNALSTIFIAVTILLVVAAQFFQRQKLR
jgi:spermidine/putrescine transport system permease protein